MAEVLLQATGLVKRFGGLAAVNGVNLQLWRGRIHAVLGPNGAGKSTLTNLLSGDLPPTEGKVALLGRDVTGFSSERISRAGLGRSYQKTNIFGPLTVWENLRLAAQSRQQRPWAFWQAAASDAAVNESAEAAMELCGLQGRRHAVASAASHGEQRQLEVGMVLATQPRVLLFDEPLAGMGAAEAQAMVALLLRLKTDYAVMLVEHDMDAVFAVADHITVMVNGEPIASDLPGAIRGNALVQAAYLGEDAHDH